jgi:hypothetical protein
LARASLGSVYVYSTKMSGDFVHVSLVNEKKILYLYRNLSVLWRR